MSKSNVIDLSGRETGHDPLTELLRAGTERLICQAVEAGLQELLAKHVERSTGDGKAGVVRNGHLPTTQAADRRGTSDGQNPEDPGKDRRAGNIPISLGCI